MDGGIRADEKTGENFQVKPAFPGKSACRHGEIFRTKMSGRSYNTLAESDYKNSLCKFSKNSLKNTVFVPTK
jgi:hypothetical protein